MLNIICTAIFLTYFLNFFFLLVTFIGEDDMKLQLYGAVVIAILLAILTFYDKVISFKKMIAIRLSLIGINVIR